MNTKTPSAAQPAPHPEFRFWLDAEDRATLRRLYRQRTFNRDDAETIKGLLLDLLTAAGERNVTAAAGSLL